MALVDDISILLEYLSNLLTQPGSQKFSLFSTTTLTKNSLSLRKTRVFYLTCIGAKCFECYATKNENIDL
ncbi:12415_t:CDS:1, partial [Funneliformis geosporum]